MNEKQRLQYKDKRDKMHKKYVKELEAFKKVRFKNVHVLICQAHKKNLLKMLATWKYIAKFSEENTTWSYWVVLIKRHLLKKKTTFAWL